MTFEALAEDVEFAIGESALERPVLVGHSMGGMVVQTLLRRAAGRLSRRRALLHVAGVRQSGGRFPEEVRGGPARAARCRPHHGRRWRRDAADSIMGPNADPAGRALFIEDYRGGAGGDLSRGSEMPRHLRPARQPADIRIPVLCLAAEHDRNAPPPVLEKMASKIPGAC